MSERKISKVVVIGYGYWGRKVAGKLKELGALGGIVEPDDLSRDKAFKDFEGVRPFPYISPYLETTLTNEITNENFDSVTIVTPPETHYQIAFEALNRGLHVFCEKPLTTDYQQAIELVKLARDKGLTLKTGLIYLHAMGLQSIPIPVGGATLYVRLLNLQGAPSDSTRDILYAGMPHALSVALHFFKTYPDLVRVKKSEAGLACQLIWTTCNCEAYLEVADYTNVRQRGVELVLKETGLRYLFDADEPQISHKYSSNGEPLILGDPCFPLDPLTCELQSFLNGHGDDHRGYMGAKVTCLLEKIKSESLY